MNKSLIDTDILSEIGKGIDPIVVRNQLAYRRAHGRFTVSAISIMESIRGYRKVGASSRLMAFRNSMTFLEILPFDQDAADLAGMIQGDLERIGQSIGVSDPMIAAIAIINGLDLVTGNTAHYQRIPPLGHSLTLVNWRH